MKLHCHREGHWHWKNDMYYFRIEQHVAYLQMFGWESKHLSIADHKNRGSQCTLTSLIKAVNHEIALKTLSSKMIDHSGLSNSRLKEFRYLRWAEVMLKSSEVSAYKKELIWKAINSSRDYSKRGRSGTEQGCQKEPFDLLHDVGFYDDRRYEPFCARWFLNEHHIYKLRQTCVSDKCKEDMLSFFLNAALDIFLQVITSTLTFQLNWASDFSN